MAQKNSKHIKKTSAKKLLYFLVIALLIIIAFYIVKDTKISPLHREAKILFVGDMFFDRQIRSIMSKKGGDYVFSCNKDFLKNFDTVVGNLEGPITKNASVSLGSEVGSPNNYIFTFPVETAKLLKKYNINIVSLGNNHINNFGEAGIASTHKYLDEAGIEYFGGISGDEPLLRKTISGVHITFIAYNQFGGQTQDKIVNLIKKEKDSGQKVIIFAHWGEEYVGATGSMKSTARRFANAGADLIIGSHPHVILEQEKIGNTEVYYSLGNFIFDQYWTHVVKNGMGVEVNLTQDSITTNTHALEINSDGRTCVK